MQEITIYKALDGKTFEAKEECIEYENNLTKKLFYCYYKGEWIGLSKNTLEDYMSDTYIIAIPKTIDVTMVKELLDFYGYITNGIIRTEKDMVYYFDRQNYVWKSYDTIKEIFEKKTEIYNSFINIDNG